jgi:hypothetical protein
LLDPAPASALLSSFVLLLTRGNWAVLCAAELRDLDFQLQQADMLSHLENASDACGIDPFVCQGSDLFEGSDILVGVETIFPGFARWREQ